MGRGQTGPSRLTLMLDPTLPVLLVVVPLLDLLGRFPRLPVLLVQVLSLACARSTVALAEALPLLPEAAVAH